MSSTGTNGKIALCRVVAIFLALSLAAYRVLESRRVMDPRDDAQYHRCALREIREEFALPTLWKEPLSLPLSAYPTGQRLVRIQRSRDDTAHRVAVWLVLLPHDVSHLFTRLTADGAREAAPHSLRWRPAADVLANLSEFAFLAPMREALSDLVDHPEY